MKHLFISILVSIVILSCCFAVTINVPSQYPTIQAGIDSATDGDTVLVADRT